MELVWGVFRLVAIAAAMVWLAGCMTAAVGPGSWGRGFVTSGLIRRSGSAAGRLVTGARLSAAARWPVRNCRTAASPTRSPDPQALQKFAQESAALEVTRAGGPRRKRGSRFRGLRCFPPGSSV